MNVYDFKSGLSYSGYFVDLRAVSESALRKRRRMNERLGSNAVVSWGENSAYNFPFSQNKITGIRTRHW